MTGGMLFGPDDKPIQDAGFAELDAIAAKAIAERQKPYKLLKIADVLAMEDPEHLIESMVPKNGMTVLYGPSGTFKSFVALDWALSVAAGIPWFGRQVQQAPVVYVAGEGVAGMKLRIQAWQLSHGGADPTEHFHLLPNAVNLLDTDEMVRVAGALAGVNMELGQPCGLLIVDTMARALVGGDENSARDVGLFIANLDEIVRPLASLVVHHSGKDGGVERGSSALRGAADSMIKTERSEKDKRNLTLKCAKSKDAEEFPDGPLVIVPTGPSVSLQIDLTPQHEREPDLKFEVLGYIAQRAEPVHKSQVRSALGRRQKEVYEAIDTLEFEEKIEQVQDGRKVLWRVCPDRVGHTGTSTDPAGSGNPGGNYVPRGGPRRGSPRDTVPEPTTNRDLGSLSRADVAPMVASPLADVDAGVQGSTW
jgi:hypothetical protein